MQTPVRVVKVSDYGLCLQCPCRQGSVQQIDTPLGLFWFAGCARQDCDNWAHGNGAVDNTRPDDMPPLPFHPE